MTESLKSIVYKLCIANEEDRLLKRAMEIQTGVVKVKSLKLRLKRSDIPLTADAEVLQQIAGKEEQHWVDIILPVLDVNEYSLRYTYKINHPIEGEIWVDSQVASFRYV